MRRVVTKVARLRAADTVSADEAAGIKLLASALHRALPASPTSPIVKCGLASEDCSGCVTPSFEPQSAHHSSPACDPSTSTFAASPQASSAKRLCFSGLGGRGQ